MANVVTTIIAIVFGGILNMVVAVWAEHRRQAALTLEIEEPAEADLLTPGGSLGRFRSLKVRASNTPSGWLGRWMRSPALQCRATITFHRVLDGTRIFDRPMDARWADSLQPIPIPAVDTTGNIAFYLQDSQRLAAGSRVNIYPGESEPLDIVVRFDNDVDCYGWNNETYFRQPLGRNPDWRLGSEVFLVKVTITSTGRKCEGVFRLINDVPYNAFRLDRASETEIARVS
jgi:hypothetical protein